MDGSESISANGNTLKKNTMWLLMIMRKNLTVKLMSSQLLHQSTTTNSNLKAMNCQNKSGQESIPIFTDLTEITTSNFLDVKLKMHSEPSSVQPKANFSMLLLNMT